ncbi:hypothetical protein V7x_52230 [Crateriforma conspicua]|uniref:Uncharacterized protein n=2 Tax=Crateriforma conspicua TaxID=2527996 RepID=A0A5C6FIZ5_9PLAN|nr:hypothetical protein V7x_52230 [Crateriforma conspicua]
MPPFDGACVHNDDELNLGQLREILTAAIIELSKKYPTIDSFHDWHEHDGFIVDSKSESWNTLRLAIQTDRTLFNSRHGDFAVRIAVCPTSYDWLLRYNIDEDDESDYNSATCDFDLTVAKHAKKSDIAGYLLSNFPNLLVEHDSHSWFKSNYGG